MKNINAIYCFVDKTSLNNINYHEKENKYKADVPGSREDGSEECGEEPMRQAEVQGPRAGGGRD